MNQSRQNQPWRAGLSGPIALACVSLAGAMPLMGGCGPRKPVGTSGPAPVRTVSHGEPLDQRAKAYWQAKADEDWDVLYSYVYPHIREDSSPAEFVEWSKANDPFRIMSYELGDTLTEGDMGWVEVSYQTALRKYPQLPAKEAGQWQKWRRINGEWLPVSAQEVSLFPAPPTDRDAAGESQLRARFLESWDARANREWSRLYELTDPRDRATVSEAEFRDSEALFDYRSYEILWIEVIGDEGRVRVRYHHKLLDPSLSKLPPRDAIVIEHWIRTDGEWYRDLVR